MSFEYVHMSTKKEAEEYFKEKGYWMVANVRQSMGWPDYKVIVYFRGVPILFIPEVEDRYPAVAVLCRDGINQNKAREIIHHFLSSLAWSNEAVIEIEAWGGGSYPTVYGRPLNVRMLRRPFRIMYLPDTEDPEARLALAFYREAMALDHSAYGFLSFYKIINLKYRSGDAQKNWIEEKLANVDYFDGKKRFEELKKDLGSDAKVSEYLYHSCRCAIAHADINQETVNPEDYEGMARLRSDLPLIRGLVELLIEEEFNILREATIHKKHPYELFGFKAILGEEAIKEIINDNPVKGVPFPEEISIRLWGAEQFKLFEGLKVENVGVKEGGLIVESISSNNVLGVVLRLDFKQGRIMFDPQRSIRIIEDNGSLTWVESKIEIQRFLRKYWLNGILEIWDPKNNICLGFSDAFVPVNIDLTRTIDNFDKEIEESGAEIEKRRENDDQTVKKDARSD